MRYGGLERSGRSAGEVILIMSDAEARMLSDMANAAVSAAPRKTTWAAMRDEIDNLPCF